MLNIRKIKKDIIRIFWPEICPFCGRAFHEGICPGCRKKLKSLKIREPRCMKCGKSVLGEQQEYCHDCMHTHHYYDRGLSLWLHREPVSLSVYQFKFHNQRAFAEYYAEEMLCCYDAVIRDWKPDFIIPIPLHPGKQRKRGYNQAHLLADELGKRLGIPIENLVRRVKKTKPQKSLEPQRRKKNLEAAFEMRAEKDNDILFEKTVLLVDDIYTTGSTIDAVSKILKKAGAQKVYYLSISIGQGY